MAQALLKPALVSGALAADQVVACVRRPERAAALSAEFGVPVGIDPRPVGAATNLLLAVKPQQLEGVVEQLSREGAIAPGLLVSILAGVNLQRLQRSFPTRRCVRAIPNMPCRIQQGLTGICWGDGLSAVQQQRVRDVFQCVGSIEELSESQCDAFLALASSGPGLAAVVVEAFADGAVAAGLPRQQALAVTRRMLAGTMALLDQEDLHPAALKDAVCSPGGATILGVAVLERNGLRGALIEAIRATTARSRELA